jgi:hypothetical protein
MDKDSKDIEASLEHTISVGEGAEKRIVGARDVDEALKFLEANAGVVNFEDVDEKRLIRKVDLTLMPLMFLCYFLQYSDKTLINYAVRLPCLLHHVHLLIRDRASWAS